MPMATSVCEQCGTPLLASHSAERARRFCSRSCMIASMTLPHDAKYIEANSIPEPNSGCWLWLGQMHKEGYGDFQLKNAKSKRAHRVSWIAYNGDIPSGLVVRHKCDNRACVNPAHLELGTCLDNNADMVSRKRHAKGEHVGSAVLRQTDVLEIRKARIAGTSVLVLAARYRVCSDNIYRIIRGETWGHLAGATDAACVSSERRGQGA